MLLSIVVVVASDVVCFNLKPGTSDGSGTSRPHLNQVLDDMKSHSVTVEASVAEVLALADHKGATQLRKECRKLLAEVCPVGGVAHV